MDKEKFLKSRLPEAEVDIPGVGTVRVRGMSRAESLALQGLTNIADIDRKMLHFGLVDPFLTEDEVEQLQKATLAYELEPVTNKILELSGATEGADKSSVDRVGDESEPGE